MSKTLVIVLSETRASELTFENFKKNVIDELNADLCVCIGVKPDYDYENPFYKLAKYHFVYDEPDDFADAFEYAYDKIPKNDTEQLHWREFLKIKDQFLGGIKDPHDQHPGSAGILIFFRWFLLENLYKNNIIDEYDRFIITRSDYLYRLPHPQVTMMDPTKIWIPDAENYGGYTDRHVVLSKEHVTPYLNILNNMVTRSNEYFTKMKKHNHWNLEKLIKFHLEQNNVLNCVREFPYVMYSVRSVSGTSRWSLGNFDKTLGYYIKYKSEYNKSNDYLTQFKASKLDIQDYYQSVFDKKH